MMANDPHDCMRMKSVKSRRKGLKTAGLLICPIKLTLPPEKNMPNQVMGGVFAKYSVQAVAWLFSKKSGLFFGISRFKKIDTVS